MQIETRFIMTLSKAEAQALARLCGGVTGEMLTSLSMTELERKAVGEIYSKMDDCLEDTDDS